MSKDKEEAFAEIDRLRALVAEMLKALEMMLYKTRGFAHMRYGGSTNTSNEMAQWQVVVGKAEAAIAKAKGE